MLMDYPGLIMKFTLLVQAGLTARKAFQKIALDYGKKKMEKSGRLMKKSGQHVMKWTVEFLRQRHIEDLESDVDR